MHDAHPYITLFLLFRFVAFGTLFTCHWIKMKSTVVVV